MGHGSPSFSLCRVLMPTGSSWMASGVMIRAVNMFRILTAAGTPWFTLRELGEAPVSIAGSLQKVVGFVLTVFLGACLVIAWVLTMPLIDCGYYLNEMRRKW